MSLVQAYINEVEELYKRGIATEHSYRPALQKLLQGLSNGMLATNEPKRIECGAPDFIIQKKDLIIGYVEAKDIGKSLDDIEKTDQLKRYLSSLGNLILTNHTEFRLYIEGEKCLSTSLGEFDKKRNFIPRRNVEEFEQLLKTFFERTPVPIKNAKELAIRMASAARLIHDIILKALEKEKEEVTTLTEQLKSFRKVLLHDLSEKQFADMYSQTICYGLFASRVNVPKGEEFNRKSSIYFVPRTNPFLRNMFNHIAGPELDKRITWLVDDLSEVLNNTDVHEILKNFGQTTNQTDPILHFYETFLAQYDAETRERRGVYYTPSPVVSYIVNSVDTALEKKYKIDEGLANTEYSRYKNLGAAGGKTVTLPKVQILDPAVGTGTFLHEVINNIHKRFEGNEGMWPDYVKEHLLPRIFGFEILMAPYTIAHMTLGLRLTQSGYSFNEENRLKIYLTNTLEEPKEMEGLTLFSHWLATEVNAANEVKGITPIMVILGNPPYSNFGRLNSNEWVNDLLGEYKKGLNEKKLNLNDDYIKFIRFSQWKIAQNGKGILAFITNNSFLSGITHRQMRKSLLETFDEIYILNLHGDISERVEFPEDENVFNITRGVCISIFIKKSDKSDKLASLFYKDLVGKRKDKYAYLKDHDILSTDWTKLEPKAETYYFAPFSSENEVEYKTFWAIPSIFKLSNSGIQTKKDKLTVHFTEEELNNTLEAMKTMDAEELRREFDLGADGRDWKVGLAKQDVEREDGENITIQYRPFDMRKTYYTGRSKGFVAYPRHNLTSQLLHSNLALATMRQLVGVTDLCQVLATKNMLTDRAMKSRNGTPYIFPLYQYPTEEEVNSNLFRADEKMHNLSFDFLLDIEEKTGLYFVEENGDLEESIDAEQVFYYIYAMTNSNTYRERYYDFIKKDFPRIPITKDKGLFIGLIKLGENLTRLHLFEKTTKINVRFPNQGSDTIERIEFIKNDEEESGNVFINDTQFFTGVKEEVWNYHIGGYQVALQWLKERKNRTITYNEKVHYMRMLSIISSTLETVQDIDNLILNHGGWPLA